jgi:hypothetical protein
MTLPMTSNDDEELLKAIDNKKMKERNTIGMFDFYLDYLQSLGFERFKLLRPRKHDMTGY